MHSLSINRQQVSLNTWKKKDEFFHDHSYANPGFAFKMQVYASDRTTAPGQLPDFNENKSNWKKKENLFVHQKDNPFFTIQCTIV